MLQEVVPASLDTLIGEAAKIKVESYRFVTITCVELSENKFDLLYHFDRDFQLKHMRLIVAGEQCVPSITPVYFAAFLVENEIQDLFGIHFDRLAIDYERSLYLDPEVQVAPFCKFTVARNRCEKPIVIPESTGSLKDWKASDA